MRADVDYIRRAKDVLDIELAGLQKVRDSLNAEFADAVRLILDCLTRNGKVVVTGVGKSLHIAEKIAATLASTGTTSVALNPMQAMHGDLGVVSAGDVLLALSYSGESEELLTLIPAARRMSVKIIAFTGAPASALATCSDVVVPVRVDREACPFGMAPTASTTATLAVGDALAMVLLEARGFRQEDYATLHPAGAIGRALLVRVSDIMRSGSRLAQVPQTASVRDAVLAMTQARSGSTGIIDGNGCLLGIFTDGDLRRHITADLHILTRCVADVMTPSPLTVRGEQLAVDVLRVFETHNIDDILVVDAAGKLIGAVDIQDLPKMKIL
ncbi:MAG: KpsF/GutQ family sugar-phosphate isomerase [Lentisphaerae bacterium]|nr:KpsF/GutQ family sugar-phosphate isomerase [Lentisphaerota bacterium]